MVFERTAVPDSPNLNHQLDNALSFHLRKMSSEPQSRSQGKDEIEFFDWLETRLAVISEESGVQLDCLVPNDATPIVVADTEEEYTQHLSSMIRSGLPLLAQEVFGELHHLKDPSPRVVRRSSCPSKRISPWRHTTPCLR